jgi:hypothetical protein
MTLRRLVGSRGAAILIFSCLPLATGGLQATAQSAGDSHVPVEFEGNILKIDGQTLTVAVPQDIKITGGNADQKLGTLSIGDTVKLSADKDIVAQGKNIDAEHIEKHNERVRVSVQNRLLAGFIAFILVSFVAALAAGRSTNNKTSLGNPLSFCVGIDNRTSNSQTQLAFWSATVLVTYLTTVFLRGWATNWALLGGVGIPTNLLAFSGLSALSFGGARTITTSKVNESNASAGAASARAEAVVNNARAAAGAATSAAVAAQAASNNSGPAAAAAATYAAQETARMAQMSQAAAEQLVAQPTSGDANIKSASPTPANITQLFQNDMGQADLGDTQMILITLIAIATYVVTTFHQLGNLEIAPQVLLPDIDSYLLASFGIGQGAYLAKKAASNIREG